MRAVAFDLDGTLAVPEPDRATILREALESVGAPPIPRAAYLRAHRQHLTGDSREPIFATLLADRDAEVDPGRVARAYRERITAAVAPVDGVEDLVADLRSEYVVGLLTNGPVRAQRDKLDALGWTDRFDAALVSGDLPAGKPDPRAFEALVDALGVEPREAVYVGDDPEADVRGARNAGLRAVQVLEAGDESAPGADAAVPREELARRLPGVLRGLEG